MLTLLRDEWGLTAVAGSEIESGIYEVSQNIVLIDIIQWLSST